MAYVTFAIVGIFLSFNLPRIVVAGYEVSQTWLILHCVQNGSEYMPVLPFYYWDSISRLFMVINSSLNFLVYCTGSDQFKVSLNLPRGIYKLRSTYRFTKEIAEQSMLFVKVFFYVFYFLSTFLSVDRKNGFVEMAGLNLINIFKVHIF